MILPVNLGAADSAEVIIKSNGLLIALKGLMKIFETFLASIYVPVSIWEGLRNLQNNTIIGYSDVEDLIFFDFFFFLYRNFFWCSYSLILEEPILPHILKEPFKLGFFFCINKID